MAGKRGWLVGLAGLVVAARATGQAARACLAGEPQFVEVAVGLLRIRDGCVAWGDYNDDGYLDLALAGQCFGGGDLSRIYRGSATGSMTDLDMDLQAVEGSCLAWGDYDNDGDLDLALAGAVYGGPLRSVCIIYRNEGNDVFVDIQADLLGVSYGGVAWGDYDNDGDLDLAVVGHHRGEQPASVRKIYRNDRGTFTDANAGLPSEPSYCVAWGDYDNDGDLDLAIAGVPSAVYRNDQGTFTDTGTKLVTVAMARLAWGDYDNDGDLDLVIAGDTSIPAQLPAYSSVTRVYRNDHGAFTELAAGLRGAGDCWLAWGDCDNDGDLDLALSGQPGPVWHSPNVFTTVYRNDSAGVFTDMDPGLLAVEWSALAWGDYDGDADLDLVVAGRTPDGGAPDTKLYRSEGGPANTPPAPPAGLIASVDGRRVTLAWEPSSDPETPTPGLSYNVRVGSAPGAADIVSPMAGLVSGRRHLPALGNAQMRTTSTLTSLPNGTCYWSVQAIDTAFAGSPWAEEQSFDVVCRDVDGNGCVNVSDLVLVRINLGNTGSAIDPPGCDVDGNGVVNVSDLVLVRTSLGQGCR